MFQAPECLEPLPTKRMLVPSQVRSIGKGVKPRRFAVVVNPTDTSIGRTSMGLDQVFQTGQSGPLCPFPRHPVAGAPGGVQQVSS